MKEPEIDLPEPLAIEKVVEDAADLKKRKRHQAVKTVENFQPRHVRPTAFRQRGGPDHRPPSGKHARGREQNQGAWHGTSRVVDRPAKRRANKRSWAKLLRQDRPTIRTKVAK